MGKDFRVLAINPGGTSTKIAVFDGEHILFREVLRHSAVELSEYEHFLEQYDFREKMILDTLEKRGIALNTLDAVVGRGGLVKPMEGGTYLVNEAMLEHLRIGYLGEHVCNLGAILAEDIAKRMGVSAFIVDPVVVDELDDLARISGIPEIQRQPKYHALNQRAMGRRAARDMGKRYDEMNFIVAHLGTGITVGVHQKGRIIDVNNGLDGEGPYSTERSGGVPVGDLVKMCFSGKYTYKEVKKKINGKGGMVGYIDTNDIREVKRRIANGDQQAGLVFEGMAYQISKEIASCSAVLKGDVDAVILTAGMAYDEQLTDWIKERVEFIAPVKVYPGEDELLALTEGALRVLRGEEEAKIYKQ